MMTSRYDDLTRVRIRPLDGNNDFQMTTTTTECKQEFSLLLGSKRHGTRWRRQVTQRQRLRDYVERTKESSNNGWAGGNRAKRVHSFFTIHIQYKYTMKAEENIKGNY